MNNIKYVGMDVHKSIGCGSFRTKAKRHKNNDITKFTSY